MIPLLGVAGVLAIGDRQYSELRRRHHDLEQVYRFNQAVEGLVEPDQVIQAVLSEAERGLLRARLAELALRGPDGDTRYRLVGDGGLVRTAEPDPHPMHEAVAVAEGAVLVPIATSDEDLAAAIQTSGI